MAPTPSATVPVLSLRQLAQDGGASSSTTLDVMLLPQQEQGLERPQAIMTVHGLPASWARPSGRSTPGFPGGKAEAVQCSFRNEYGSLRLDAVCGSAPQLEPGRDSAQPAKSGVERQRRRRQG